MAAGVGSGGARGVRNGIRRSGNGLSGRTGSSGIAYPLPWLLRMATLALCACSRVRGQSVAGVFSASFRPFTRVAFGSTPPPQLDRMLHTSLRSPSLRLSWCALGRGGPGRPGQEFDGRGDPKWGAVSWRKVPPVAKRCQNCFPGPRARFRCSGAGHALHARASRSWHTILAGYHEYEYDDGYSRQRPPHHQHHQHHQPHQHPRHPDDRRSYSRYFLVTSAH